MMITTTTTVLVNRILFFVLLNNRKKTQKTCFQACRKRTAGLTMATLPHGLNFLSSLLRWSLIIYRPPLRGLGSMLYKYLRQISRKHDVFIITIDVIVILNSMKEFCIYVCNIIKDSQFRVIYMHRDFNRITTTYRLL